MCGLRVKHYLDNNGIKYSFVSEKTGIPMNILSPTLNGKRKMSAEEFILICKVLRISTDYFADKPNEKATG